MGNHRNVKYWFKSTALIVLKYKKSANEFGVK